jgi:hypothetical protein
MNLTTWLLTVASLVIGNLIAPSVSSGLRVLAWARARHVKHVPADGAELYANGVPMDEAQFRSVFAAYEAEMNELGPVADRNEWQLKQGYDAEHRLSVLTGIHPQPFPIRSNPDDAWAWYRDNNPYATAELPCHHGWRLLPPGNVATR